MSDDIIKPEDIREMSSFIYDFPYPKILDYCGSCRGFGCEYDESYHNGDITKYEDKICKNCDGKKIIPRNLNRNEKEIYLQHFIMKEALQWHIQTQ